MLDWIGTAIQTYATWVHVTNFAWSINYFRDEWDYSESRTHEQVVSRRTEKRNGDSEEKVSSS